MANALRKSDAFIPGLSLVAVVDGKIIGYILFTKIQIGEYTELAFAPLAVLPEYQKKGIGAALIKEGYNIAKNLGYNYSVVLGSETYYPKSGYLPADRFGIKPAFEVPSENYMACRLRKSAPIISGTVKYSKECGIE